MQFQIKNRFTGELAYECELSADIAGKSYSLQLGFTIKKAIEARANLAGANLAGAYLTGANLAGAYLAGAYLTGAYLTRANLAGAYLTGAYLTGAYLTRANLAGANLAGAYLTGAYLTRANLAGANLAGANLTDAYLTDANLAGANLAGAKGADLAIARTRILPEGSIIGWKKCKDDVIVKLGIPAEAKRSHAWGRKCRAEYADVLEVHGADVGISLHDGRTRYAAGERVTPDAFDENWQDECSNGLHFYLTRLEAEAHR